jgi:predicted kinase
MKPILYIFSGLPGSGKTSIASEMVKILKVSYFRVDTIEQGLRNLCSLDVQGEGYGLTQRIAADNLKLGNDVVIDCVNPCELTRKEWEDVAIQNRADYINIEIVCSNQEEHRARSENREVDIEGLELPTWEEITARDYQEWKENRILIETSKKGIAECVQELIEKIGVEKGKLS